MNKTSRFLMIVLVAGMLTGPAYGAEKAKKAQPAPKKDNAAVNENAAEEVDVNKIKEKYWARGETAELGVVQNRTYSKANRFEMGGIAGVVTSDPFLSIKATGASFGYHFSEYFSAHVFGWKAFASPSSALTTLREGGKEANTNAPKSYFGAEGSGSLIYGKLSLVGKSIIYYDMHLLGGAGMTTTENGHYLTPHLGIGQNIYLTKALSLKFDYRLMMYKEQIKEKQITTKLGQVVGERTNYSNAIILGITFLWDAFK